MTGDEGAPRQWSRLRLVVSNPPAETAPIELPPPIETFPDDDEEDAALAAEVEESPYSALLRADMPDDLRAQALSALWRSDAVFGAGDPMTDFGGDYQSQAVIGEAVKSVWQAGRGYDDPAADPERD